MTEPRHLPLVAASSSDRALLLWCGQWYSDTPPRQQQSTRPAQQFSSPTDGINMAKLLVLVPALLALAAMVPEAWAADIEDCAGAEDLAKFVEAKVSGCTDDDAKCPLTRGNNVTITIKFKSNKEIKAVQQVVHGVIAGVPVPFPLENPDACQHTGLACPLTVGDHTYNYALFVKPVYPKVSVKVKWELLNEDKKQIICLMIPAILK